MDNQPESLSKQPAPSNEMDPFDFLSFTMPAPETSDSIHPTSGFDFFSQQNDGTSSSSVGIQSFEDVSMSVTENTNPVAINEQSANPPVMGEVVTEEFGKPSLIEESVNPSVAPLTQEPIIPPVTEEQVNPSIIEEPTKPVVENEVPENSSLIEEPINPQVNPDKPIMEPTPSVNHREMVQEPSRITEPFSFFSLSDSPPTEPAIEVIPQPDTIQKPKPTPVPTPTPTPTPKTTVSTKECTVIMIPLMLRD